MTVLNKPQALRPKDLIALVAPSRPASEHGPRDAETYLRQIGYRVHISPNIRDRHYYFAGADEIRAGDLNRLFADPEIQALVCARGGYGCGRLLDHLNYNAISNNPKIVIGFSDTTALLLALYSQCGMTCFTGALSDFDLGKERNELVESSLWPQLTSTSAFGRLPIDSDDLLVVRSGSAKGPLIPANLALLCSLLGTPFFPPLKDALLLVEDVDEHPYRVDRMLNQLRLSGAIENLGGLIFGQFNRCFTAEEMVTAPTLAELALELTHGTNYPIIAGIPYGHFRRRLVLPIGVEAILETSPPSLTLSEAAVS